MEEEVQIELLKVSYNCLKRVDSKMSNLGFFGEGIWVSILVISLIVFFFYFTLTFFQYLHNDDERIIKQSKVGAIICFTLALIVITIY
jgi:hypothetical protein